MTLNNGENHLNMKLQPLPPETIQQINNEVESIFELPFKLFPSPFQVPEIMGYSNDIFFNKLESFAPNERLEIMQKLFHYCSELRKKLALINTASSITSKISSFQDNIQKLKQQVKENESNIEEVNRLNKEIANCEILSKIVQNYQINNIDWMFVIISKFMKNHFDFYSTEQLLWSFCSEYFENDDLIRLSSSIKDDTGIEYEVNYVYKFPYKENVPINAHIPIIIDGVEFTDCVEVSVLHFFYMCQPSEPEMIMKYWDSIDSPKREQIKDFLRLQGPKRANNKNPSLRTIWAEIVSKIPGMIYKKKTDPSLPENDVEIVAAWCNYLKAIAYLKNEKLVWEELCKYAKMLNEKEEIFPEIKKVVCDCFAKLAGEKLQSIEWIENGPYEGIRIMEDGSLDLLGTVRCSFKGVGEKIDFIMQDGHGFIQWMNLYDDE